MKVNAKIKGLSKTIKALQNKGEEIRQKVNTEVKRSAKIIESNAKRNAPVSDGRLRASIIADPVSDEQWQVLAKASYAPYVEFGTKSKVEIPAGLEGYAMQFKGGGGSFDDLVENIEIWAKPKGIPQEAVYPIAIKIAREGVGAQPFLFPAFESERPNLMKRLRGIMK